MNRLLARLILKHLQLLIWIFLTFGVITQQVLVEGFNILLLVFFMLVNWYSSIHIEHWVGERWIYPEARKELKKKEEKEGKK